MTTYQDNDIREALRRRYADMPQMQDDFTDRLMQRIEQEQKDVRHRKWLITTIGAVAASVVLLVVFSLWPQQDERRPVAVNERMATERTTKKDTMPCTVKCRELGESLLVQMSQDRSSDKEQTTERTPKAETAQKEVAKEQVPPVLSPTDVHLHYAAQVTETDTTLIAPARLNEFIAKFADYNNVSPVSLDCATDSTRHDVTCTAYVFPDTKEVDVFGRLLLAAVAYSDTEPGYLLNYSHRQFFFTLHDEQIGRKYLWIAERITGNRILLYCTHSPIETEVSSTCFQTYRDKLTHTSIPPRTTEL